MSRLSLLKRIEKLEHKSPKKSVYVYCVYSIFINLLRTENKEEFKQVLKAEKVKYRYAYPIIINDINGIDIFEEEQLNQLLENQIYKVIYCSTKSDTFKTALKDLYKNIRIIQKEIELGE